MNHKYWSKGCLKYFWNVSEYHSSLVWSPKLLLPSSLRDPNELIKVGTAWRTTFQFSNRKQATFHCAVLTWMKQMFFWQSKGNTRWTPVRASLDVNVCFYLLQNTPSCITPLPTTQTSTSFWDDCTFIPLTNHPTWIPAFFSPDNKQDFAYSTFLGCCCSLLSYSADRHSD